MVILLLLVATVFLAYVNGANDNFKGVATLFGSRTVSYKTGIYWATLTTCTGSIVSIFLATALVKHFSGKGLVPDAIANSPEFHLAVALGTGLTVLLATLTGFPISTTHGITGALVGAGLVAIGGKVNFSALGNSFVLPLLLSPIVAIPLAMLLYALMHRLRLLLGIQTENCLCVGQTPSPISSFQLKDSSVGNFGEIEQNYGNLNTVTTVSTDTVENCNQKYLGRFFGIKIQQILDIGHFISAGIVSFARGLNDTPKIVPLILIIQAISIQWGAIAVAIAMAIGGLLNARKVAKTMSQRITAMNTGQGFTANIITGILVIAASRFGLPVSTTHVSVGSIFGVGVISKQANYQVFSQVFLSWIFTLPIAAALSAVIYKILQ
jgi:inorganic phosphate transporter, PiT family